MIQKILWNGISNYETVFRREIWRIVFGFTVLLVLTPCLLQKNLAVQARRLSAVIPLFSLPSPQYPFRLITSLRYRIKPDLFPFT
jgi:hypothetical protein